MLSSSFSPFLRLLGVVLAALVPILYADNDVGARILTEEAGTGFRIQINPDSLVRNLQDNSNLDLTLFNEVLSNVQIVVPTDAIKDSSFSQGFPGGSVNFKIRIGGRSGTEDGECNSVSIAEGGGFRVLGEELEPEDGLQRERFTIVGSGLRINCRIPMRIEIDRLVIGFVSIPLGGIQSESVGDMFITASEGIQWSQSFIVSSPDFTKTPPNATLAGDCSIDTGKLDIDADGVIAVFDNVIPGTGGINLDGQVENQLNNDASLLTAPITENICALSTELAIALGELVSQNPFTDLGPGSILSGGGFFDIDENGIIDAIDTETRLTTGLVNESLDLIRGNFLVDAIFPEGGDNEANLLEQFFDSFELNGQVINQTDAVGLVVALLNDAFNLTLSRPLLDLELIPLIETIISSQPDGDLSLFEQDGGETIMVFVDDTIDLDFVNISIRVAARDFLMSENGGTNDGTGIFTGMAVFSNFSVVLPNFALGNFLGVATIELDLSIDFDADKANATQFIQDFSVTFPRETLTFNASIDSFLAKAAGLIAINEERLENLQIGPILADALGCITSSFATPAVLTAFGGDVDKIEGLIAGFQDAVVNIAGDVANALVFSYQSVLLRGLETLLSEPLLEPPIEILETGECFEIVENSTNVANPFNFADSILQQVSDIADPAFFESLIGFVVSSEGEVDIQIIDPDDPTEFGLSLFSAGGFIQEIDFLIKDLRVIGVSPPVVTSGSIDVPEEQVITAFIDFITNDQRLKLVVDLDININEPIPDPELPEDERPSPTDPIPAIFVGTSSENQVSLSLELQNIKAFIEVIASMSEFDVEGTRIGDIANIDCWVSKLDQPGGFSENLNVQTTLAEMKMDCNCTSPILNELADAITQISGFGELNFDIQQLVNTLVGSFSDKFNEDNFADTIANAESICVGNGAIQNDFSTAPKGEKDPAAFAFIALLAAVLMFTLPFVLVTGLERRARGTRRRRILETADIKQQEKTELELAELEERYNAHQAANAGKSEEIPMYKNKHIPKHMRLLVFFLLILNFAFFIIGDFGVSLEIVLQGNLLESPLPPQDFGSFSVVTSTIDLYKNGAVGLAILIFAVALFWPYFKMLSLCFCFFSSPKVMSLKFRGGFIHFLDIFGKWSIVEVFFVVFLRLLFELTIASPRTLYLPDTDIYNIELLITPQVSFYTFGTAVLISIFISNVLMVYHEKIVRRNQDDLRNIMNIEKTNMNVFIKVSMHDYLFLTKKREIDGTPNYVFQFTPFGRKLFTFFTFGCMIITFLANFLFVAKVRYLGIARIFLELSDQESEPSFSVFSIVGSVVGGGVNENDLGAIYFGVVIVILQLFAPLCVLVSTLMIMYKGMTLKQARRHRVLRGCFAAWSTLEVFILSVAIAVIEVPEVAKALTADSCDFFVEFMGETLLPLGLVNEEDVENTCFGVKIEIPAGAYIYLFAILFNVINAVIVLKLFDAMIKQRKSVAAKKTGMEEEEQQLDAIERLDRNLEDAGERVKYSRTIWFLKKLKIVYAYPKHDPVTV